MAKRLVVRGDPVRGTDTHLVTGQATNPAPPPATVPCPPGTTGRFDYIGSMTDALSDLVRIGGRPVALVSSRSSLDPGQDAPPAGKHSGPAGTGFLPPPPAPQPVPADLSITDPIGTGRPSASAGSGFIQVGGSAVLLDGDRIDTCDANGATGNSTVAAAGQSLVTTSG